MLRRRAPRPAILAFHGVVASFIDYSIQLNHLELRSFERTRTAEIAIETGHVVQHADLDLLLRIGRGAQTERNRNRRYSTNYSLHYLPPFGADPSVRVVKLRDIRVAFPASRPVRNS